jgi:hypothetical protein
MGQDLDATPRKHVKPTNWNVHTPKSVKARLDSIVSWWIGADRHAFYRSLHERERLAAELTEKARKERIVS